MKRRTLSVVLATYNEEKNLRACLESCRGLADEIIIVDGTSTDNTVRIAKEFGARVKITTNKANFHINKQMAIDMAGCDWILQMDADEHVSAELSREIKKILNSNVEFDGYWMARKNYFLGRFLMKGGQYPDYTLRLYRKGKGRLPQKDVHEQAVVEGKVGYLKEALLHYPYKDFVFYLTKWNRYNDFAAEQIREEQKGKNVLQKILYAFLYLFVRPTHWFLTTYIRHKGFVDGWQGFTFSLFSALRFPVSYIKYFGVYKFMLLLILLLGIILRFYNFSNRWDIGGDSGRDILIAREALKRGTLPLAGSFSSAGPFAFGPAFYWFLMSSYVILPFLLTAPWIFLCLLGVFDILIFAAIGNLLSGRKLSLIVALFVAISPQLIARSYLLGQHSFIPFCAAMAILFFLLAYKNKKIIYFALTGFFVGLGINFHYEMLNFLLLIPFLLFIPSLKFSKKLLGMGASILGIFVALLPTIIWDSRQSYANTRNILDYFLIAQYRLYVPNSWKLFIFNALPNYWSFVIGRFYLVALILFLISGAFFLYFAVKRKLKIQFFFLGIIFYFLLIVNRYYHGERSESYLLYLLPFVLIFSAWAVSTLIYYPFLNNQKIFSLQKIVGVVLFAAVIYGSFVTDFNYLRNPGGIHEYFDAASRLEKMFPNDKFKLYQADARVYDVSRSLSLILSWEGKLSDNGVKVVVNCNKPTCPKLKGYITNVWGESAYLVSANNQKILGKIKLAPVNQNNVYDELTGWLMENRLRSNFSLSDYIKQRLSL